MNSILHHKVIKVLVLLVIIFLAVSVGYFFGTKQEKDNYIELDDTLKSGLLVEVSYSGGWMTAERESASAAYFRIYNDGQIYERTRSGKNYYFADIGGSNIIALKNLIDAAKFDEIFVKKDRSFCLSYTDGMDTKITFYLSDGSNVSFSDCDYSFDRKSPLLSMINILTSEK